MARPVRAGAWAGKGKPEQRQEPEAGAEEECDQGSAWAREYASAGMGQQVGRVGEAPGLQQAQPRGIRGSSAARPSGRRRDLAGRTTEAGFNIFTQHGECVRAPARGCRGDRGWGRGGLGGKTGSPRGSRGGRVPESGGGIGCHLGQSREARLTPPPGRLQPGWQLPGAEEEGEVVLGTVDGLSPTPGRGLCGLGWTVDSIARGGKDEGRCEFIQSRRR